MCALLGSLYTDANTPVNDCDAHDTQMAGLWDMVLSSGSTLTLTTRSSALKDWTDSQISTMTRRTKSRLRSQNRTRLGRYNVNKISSCSNREVGLNDNNRKPSLVNKKANGMVSARNRPAYEAATAKSTQAMRMLETDTGWLSGGLAMDEATATAVSSISARGLSRMSLVLNLNHCTTIPTLFSLA